MDLGSVVAPQQIPRCSSLQLAEGRTMMVRSRLHVLRRRSAGGFEADSVWIEASSTEAAIVQARSVAATVLADAAGIALLMKGNVVLWSERRGMPRPDHLRAAPM